MSGDGVVVPLTQNLAVYLFDRLTAEYRQARELGGNSEFLAHTMGQIEAALPAWKALARGDVVRDLRRIAADPRSSQADVDQAKQALQAIGAPS